MSQILANLEFFHLSCLDLFIMYDNYLIGQEVWLCACHLKATGLGNADIARLEVNYPNL